MKKFVFFTLFLAQLYITKAQNLVSNGNFEAYSALPSTYGQVNLAIGWDNVSSSTASPDYFNTGGTVPTFFGQINPVSGAGQMGICTYHSSLGNYREYITTQLSTSLIAGQQYNISFFVSQGNNGGYSMSSNGLGIYFSNAILSQGGSNTSINVTPQVEISSIITASNTWVQYSFTIVAGGSFNYLTMGNFRNDANTLRSATGSIGAYYFLDSLVVKPVCVTSPAAPTVSAVQPTCATPTGTITVTSPAGPGFTYSIDGVSYTNSSGVFTGLAPGTYNVTVQNSAGCVSSSTAIIINPVPGLPSSPAVTITQPNCTTATGTITVSSPIGAGLTYSIDGSNYSNTTGVFNNLAPGSYNVTVRNSSGCTSTVTVAVVNIPPPIPAQPTISITNSTCSSPDGTITVSSPTGAGLFYSIDGISYSNTTGVFNNLAPGTYNVTVTNGNCTSPATVAIVNAVNPLILTLTASPNPVAAGSAVNVVVTGNRAFTITSWQPASLFPNQTATTQNIIVNTPATVTVMGKTAEGCYATAQIVITVRLVGDVWIPNTFTPDNNKLNDIFYVHGNSIKKLEMTIWNRWGEKLFFSQDQGIGWDGTYKGKAQPVGVYVYLVKIVSTNGMEETITGSVNLVR